MITRRKVNFINSKYLTVVFFVLTINFSYSQLNVTSGATATQYAQELVGTGVSISNATLLVNNNNQIGFFSNGNSTNIGIDNGVVLSTGNVNHASGTGFDVANTDYTDDCGFIITSPCPSTAPDLADIANDAVYDAAILEFDFIPSGPVVTFQFVFGSEEYPVYVNDANDAFGIFLSGPGINGPFSNNGVNIASVPNTTTPISINTVNDGQSSFCNNPGSGCQNCAYYVNNCGGNTISYNGFTTVITATYNVLCGETYHIKIGIADAFDGELDSGVFIKGRSLESGIEVTPNPVTICAGDNVELAAEVIGTSGGTFSWKPDNQTTPSITVSPTTTTEYIAYYTHSGCEITDTVIVTVENCVCTPPDLTINSINECVNNADLNSAIDPTSDAATNTFYNNQTDAENATNPIGNTVNSSGTYWVRAELPGDPDCFNVYEISVTLTILTYTTTLVEPQCGNSDGEIILSASDGTAPYNYSIEYSGNNEQNNHGTFTGLPTGSYDITITDANGCSIIDPGAVILNEESPVVVIAPADIDICLGESVTLIAINPDGATISWDQGITDGVSFTPNASGSTTYTVTATNSENCSATDQVTITVHNAPIVDAGTDFSICQGDVAILTATGADTYNWTNLGAGATQTVSPTITTTYEVTGTDQYGCINTDQVTVSITPNPTPQFEVDTIKGCEPLNVNFTNLSSFSGGTCQWSFGDGNTSSLCDNVTYTYQSSGLYSVSLTITDIIGCTGTTTIQNYIEVTPKPTAMFSADPMVTSVSNPIVNFTNETINGTGYTWTFGDGSPSEHTYVTTHRFPDDEEGTYIVTLIATNGQNCSDTASAIIKVEEDLIFYVPNSFTPDNNEFNDKFKPIFSAGFDPQSYTFSIYNRWGEIIFESHDVNIGWDGSYGINNIKVAQDGTYVWRIKIKETGRDKHNEYSGHIILLR